jgi:hypothetical protein
VNNTFNSLAQLNMKYTGVGSRSTPENWRNFFKQLAAALAARGYTLRSGAAAGADKAFESGAKEKEIYLPWPGFGGSNSQLYGPNLNRAAAEQLVSEIHPAWHKLNTTARKLHIRNAFQVLGPQLTEASKFLICWTPEGAEVGGTRTAIVIARRYGVPTFNFGKNPEQVYQDLIKLI